MVTDFPMGRRLGGDPQALMRWFPGAAVSLIAWGVLAFGGEYPWAYAPLLVFASTIGILGLAVRAGPVAPRRVVVALALIFGAVGLQLCPLPALVLDALSPARLAHDYPALFAATVPTASGPDQASEPWSISVSPVRTLLGAAFLGALSLFFVGCCRALAIVRASALVRGLMALGLFVALVAIGQEASDSRLVYGLWWPRKVESPPAATRPYAATRGRRPTGCRWPPARSRPAQRTGPAPSGPVRGPMRGRWPRRGNTRRRTARARRGTPPRATSGPD